MTEPGPVTGKRRRWALLALTVVVVAVAVVALAWVVRDASASDEDCVIVEDVARQWNANSEQVSDSLLNGAGRPEDYLTVADLQDEMAQKLNAAADSVDSTQVREKLETWAAGATEYAQLQRSVADAGPDDRSPEQLDAEFLALATTMNDAATALGQICPAMPSAER